MAVLELVRRFVLKSPRRFALPSLMIAFAIAVFAGGALLRADEDEADGELLKDKAKAVAGEPGAATKPATQPAIAVSPEVRAELNALRDAYRELKSLRLAGTIRGEQDVAGQQRTDAATFDSTFQAPAQFRHAIRDGENAKSSDGLILGGTGEKLYAFEPVRNRYQMIDAPKGRVAAGKLAVPFLPILEAQNPSLLLALSEDASAELLRDIKSVEKAEDVKIGDAAYTALKMEDKDGGRVTVLIDPKTHLVRRVTADIRKAYDTKGLPDVNKAEFTIDYAEATIGAGTKPEAFAWAAPEGARDVGSSPLVALTAEDDEEGGGEAAASALEGKAAPDFTLKDADGKEVSLSELKGSVVLLDFWATWCPPCRASLPHLNQIYEDNKAAGLKAYAVNLREDEDLVGKFAEKTKLTMPVLFDTKGKVAESYSVSGIPQTVVIGKDGTIKKVTLGSGTHEAIRKAVEEAMK